MEDYLLSNGFRERLNEKMMAFLGAKLQNDESRAILGAMFELVLSIYKLRLMK